MKHIEPQKGDRKFDKTFQEHEVIHLCSGARETVFTIACKYYLLLFKDYENHINIKKSEFSFSSVMPVCMIVLRTVPTIVIAHTFCASPDTRISYRQCLLIQGYFCVI